MGDVEPVVPTVKKRSDLPVRVVSAVVMVTVAGLALWFRGWVLDAFIAVIVLCILFEWAQLVVAFEQRAIARALWLALGAGYLGLAGYTALVFLAPSHDVWSLPSVIATVIAIDVGAYFAGRTLGGPKIAAKISPSKTWSGLAGGALAATFALTIDYAGPCEDPPGHFNPWQDCFVSQPFARFEAKDLPIVLLFGLGVAIIAQSGDFFESWMKRRAGVKDSGRLIPGHGGVFDRADGLIAVLFAIGIFRLFFT